MIDQSARISRRRFLGSAGAGLAALGALPVIYQGSLEGSPLVVGHRGAAGLEAPNTVAGIERAVDLGADGVSLDVRKTADGELVLFHDPILDVATDGSGRLERTTFEELRDVRVDGEQIPTLREGLAELEGSGLWVFLELKKTGYGESTLEVVSEHYDLGRTVITSFKPPALAAVASSAVARGALGSVPSPELVDDAVSTGSTYAMSHYTPYGIDWLVDECRERDVRAGVWELVATETHLEDALSFDIDVLTTNRPDLALELMGR